MNSNELRRLKNWADSSLHKRSQALLPPLTIDFPASTSPKHLSSEQSPPAPLQRPPSPHHLANPPTNITIRFFTTKRRPGDHSPCNHSLTETLQPLVIISNPTPNGRSKISDGPPKVLSLGCVTNEKISMLS